MSRARDLSKLLTDGISTVIPDNTVNLTKIQNVSTDRLVGRDTAGTGTLEQIQVTGGLEFTDTGSLRTSAFTGDVTKAAGGTALTIAAGAVVTADLADSAVTTAKIADSNVTTAKIASSAVTAAKVDTTGVAVLGTAQQYTRTHNFTATTLTDGTNIAWDLSQNQVAIVTLAGNRALSNPTNQVNGAVYILVVKQDSTGSRTLSFGTTYKFPSGTAPTLSTGANKVDVLTFISDGTNLYGVSSLNY
ncbi:MAG: hypothetical protein EBZ40_12220 [Gammaproteobacteria bacterium]|nr:hypothetical protein [Gammaproteobacteria bacterium]